MLASAKNIQELADKLEKDDQAYSAAVIDIIRRGYNSSYAVYMLDVPSEEILELFKDNQQVRAVRSQIVAHVRTKATNRKRFATIGQSGSFGTGSESKENIELFCTLDPSKFTPEFWNSLWMAGYINYDLYTEVENKLIVVGYKDYFETLDKAATLLTLPVEGFFQLGRYILGTGATRLFLTELEVNATKQIALKSLPETEILVEELGLASSALNAVRLKNQLIAKQIVDGHAFEKHVIQGGEFPGITTHQQFQEYLERIMNSPNTLVKNVPSGKTAFYDKSSNTIIIHNPGASDRGTAFKPERGIDYFFDFR